MHAKPGAEFAAHVAFYPPCWVTYIDDEAVSARPIRIFHGDAADVTPIAPCRRYVERLWRAGADVSLTGYAGAHHVFDAQGPVRRVTGRFGSGRCELQEIAGGRIVNRETGAPITTKDACLGQGHTYGHDAAAFASAKAAVRAFFVALFKLAP